MKNFTKFLSILLFLGILITSCSKSPNDKPTTTNPIDSDGIEFITYDNVVNGIANQGQHVTYQVIVEKANVYHYDYTWYINDEKASSDKYFSKTFNDFGEYKIKCVITSGEQSAEKSFDIVVLRASNTSSSKWISEIIEYRPAPGQFINKSPGNMASANGIVGKKGMVSLGGFGGYVIFKFDHTVINKNGYDFVIHGNAFEGSSEAGAVMVAFDKNGNGKPDSDEWFELKGELYNDPQTVKNYEITYTKPSQTTSAMDVPWKDNQNGTGAIHSKNIIAFHKQCYYPLFLEGNPNQLIFKGTKLKNLAIQDPDSGFWDCKSAGWGYADNISDDYMETVNDDRDTQRANKFNIDNAVDANGNSVNLKAIDFIKVYNCLNQEAGWLGETSTEVCGAISLTAKK